MKGKIHSPAANVLLLAVVALAGLSRPFIIEIGLAVSISAQTSLGLHRPQRLVDEAFKLGNGRVAMEDS